uniref:Uncharacterized protein n=1 Tax=Cucumis melo TaxID=3656 RepID=A0A9I9E351_CUCME
GNLPPEEKEGKDDTDPIYDRRRRQCRKEGRQASDPIYDLLSVGGRREGVEAGRPLALVMKGEDSLQEKMES